MRKKAVDKVTMVEMKSRTIFHPNIGKDAQPVVMASESLAAPLKKKRAVNGDMKIQPIQSARTRELSPF